MGHQTRQIKAAAIKQQRSQIQNCLRTRQNREGGNGARGEMNSNYLPNGGHSAKRCFVFVFICKTCNGRPCQFCQLQQRKREEQLTRARAFPFPLSGAAIAVVVVVASFHWISTSNVYKLSILVAHTAQRIPTACLEIAKTNWARVTATTTTRVQGASSARAFPSCYALSQSNALSQ